MTDVHRTGLEIAVIGLACRFPGARDAEQFWRNLRDGVESITFFSDEDLEAAGVPRSVLAEPEYVRARGVLEEAELFDAAFFGVNPQEARIMDPQQRVFLECAWHALEGSGYHSEAQVGPIGVYGGAYENSYLSNLRADPSLLEAVGPFVTSTGNEKDYLATRVAYKLNLTGPAVTVQTACSTSLVALHLACQGLLSGSCNLALAGGVTVRAEQRAGYRFQRGGIFSPDGHCRAFDAAAQGAVSSSGVGVVVLKRLEDALEDGDTIRAIVRGSAMNNDGARKVGYTAPSLDGQVRVIRAALTMAEVEPETISYVETHGSGTALGDPIEVAALTRVFQTPDGRKGSCAIGSVKTNIGHTHVAAGVAGVIKTILAIEHGMIPPSLHFQRPNPEIDFQRSPFYVNTALAEWRAGGAPRRAGVSSFGMGGTNAHAVLEEAPEQPPGSSKPWQLLTLSAKTEPALEAATDNLAEHLKRHPDLDLADVAYTLQIGRAPFDHRRAIVCHERKDAIHGLEARPAAQCLSNVRRPADPSVVFLFPGLGEEYPRMGWELYQTEQVFRAEVDGCCELLQPHLGTDLRAVLFSGSGPGRGAGPAVSAAAPPAPHHGPDLRRMLGRGHEEPSSGEQAELDALHAQSATFVVEYALARLWMSWGIRPQAMLGYSIGEYVAACLAGVLSLPDACSLVGRRAQLIDQTPVGAMAAVPLPEDEVARLLHESLSLAAVNGPSLCVAAGPEAAIDELIAKLADRGVPSRRLRTSRAFHSAMLEPISQALTEIVAGVSRNPARIPYLSNVTGDWITDGDIADERYWARHMCRAVRFADGVERLWRSPERVLLEVGPGQTLTSLALQARRGERGSTQMAVPSLGSSYDAQPERAAVLNALGRLWLAGVAVDWASVHAGERRHRVRLPGYPFERQRHWVGPPRDADRASAGGGAGLRRKADISEWFSVPAWQSTAPLAPVDPAALAAPGGSWLLFLDRCGVGARLAERLRQSGSDVVTVVAGNGFQRRDPGRFVIDPGRRSDYDALFQHLREEAKLPETVVHLWSVTPDAPAPPRADLLDQLDQAQQHGFYSLLFLIQTLGERASDCRVHLMVVSNHLHQVTGVDQVHPEKATILGPCAVLPQEHPNITCQSIDVVLSDALWQADALTAQLVAEAVRRAAEPTVAYRGQRRWKRVFEAVRVEPAGPRPDCLRRGGVYLITGGLGGMGLTLSEYLARTAQAKLVLVGRSGLPAPQQWDQWLTSHGEEDPTSARIRKLRALEELGAEVLMARADITDLEQMRQVLRRASARFGALNGVIHAAGVPGAGLMQFKRSEAAASVLAPKTRGALVLDTLTREQPLDFLMLCSSTIALTGGLGQADYCAANAFLDAFAQRNSAAAGPYTVSVNWDAWRKVGMAAKTMGQGEPGRSRRGSVRHPLLDECVADGPDRAIYAAAISTTDWLVDEHRMLGSPVIPGTAYLEMVRAAIEHQGHGGPLELQDVVFAAPAVLTEGEPRQVRLVLDKAPDSFRFIVLSRSAAGAGQPPWQQHVSGRAVPAAPGPAIRHDIDALIRRDGLTEVAGQLRHSGPMRFGPRSVCLEAAHTGDRSALALLALPTAFHDDLSALRLHPSLLDIATGFANLYLSNEFRMPFTYKRIQMKESLPARIYSYLRYRDLEGEVASFEVLLLDEWGGELVRIEELTMKRVADLRARLEDSRRGTAPDVAVYEDPQASLAVPTGGGSIFREHLEQGIEPPEGVEAFERILSRRLAPQVIVATRDFDAMIAQVNAAQPQLLREPGELPAAPAHPRPNVMTPYVAPRNGLERSLADLWKKLLGVSEVGIDDSFFELGGHSLLGVQLLARLRDTFHVELPLRSLFESRTVAELAAALASRLEESNAPPGKR